VPHRPLTDMPPVYSLNARNATGAGAGGK
jgi:hypothetical protein